MHPSEKFLMDNEEVRMEMTLLAEQLGPAYTAALREQLTRLGK